MSYQNSHFPRYFHAIIFSDMTTIKEYSLRWNVRVLMYTLLERSKKENEVNLSTIIFFKYLLTKFIIFQNCEVT